LKEMKNEFASNFELWIVRWSSLLVRPFRDYFEHYFSHQ
jgi:hypothetical protein